MVRCESCSSTIGHITLGTKQTGAPSAGNPHAGCDAAGAGNANKTTTTWYDKINTNRNGKRALQSHTDAMACTYLEIANARLNPKKKAVVFVSSSANVSAALSDSLFISAGSHLQLPVVRDLTYCMLASLHKLDKATLDKAAVKDNLTMVGRLLELYDSPVKVEGDLERRREGAAQDWRRCQNLLMASEAGMTNMETDKQMGTRDQYFMDVLHELQTAVNSGQGSVQLEIEEKLVALQQEVGELNKLIPAISVDKAKSMYESIKVSRIIPSKKRSFRIVFPGFSDELPWN